MTKKNYEAITVCVSRHPGATDIFVVQATRYEGNQNWDQDDSEEIRSLEDALFYAVNNAEYYRSEYPKASVVIIDPLGNEYVGP